MFSIQGFLTCQSKLPMTYKHLSQAERYQIHALMKAGHDQSQIAKLLDRHKSTISRELARNNYTAPSMPRPVGRPFLAGGYRCVRANQRARDLSCKPRVPRRMVAGTALWDCVLCGLVSSPKW